MKPLALFLILLSTYFQSPAQSNNQDSSHLGLKKYNTQEEISGITEEAFVCGYADFYNPEQNKAQIGRKKLTLTHLSPNFDGFWFKKIERNIPLAEPLSEEFIQWASENNPTRLFFKAVNQKGKTVFQIVGYTQMSIDFPPRPKIFPEFAHLDLIDFTLPENRKTLDGMELVAGQLEVVTVNKSFSGERLHEIDLSGATLNFGFGKGEIYNLYHIKLTQVIDPDIIDWYVSHKPECLVFEKVNDDYEYKLIGFSDDEFLFSPN